MITPEKITELRALAMGATPGPWNAAGETRNIRDDNGEVLAQAYYRGYPDESAVANAHYFAALDPATVLALLDAAERGMRNS